MLHSHTATQPPDVSRSVARDRAVVRAANRGAVLVHAAFAIAGLLAFSAISIDLGALWVSRGQIQNAADAAALAGAADLAYGVAANAPATAQAVAQTHRVWGQPVGPASVPLPTVDACPAAPASTRDTAGDCLRVLVERRTSSGTGLPVFFSRIFGTSSGEVWASSTAGVLLDNATPCPRPFGILDRWTESSGNPLTPTDTFDPGDVYNPPTPAGTGTGFSFADVGSVLTFTYAGPSAGPPTASQMVPLDLPGAGGSPEDRYYANVTSCSAGTMSLGATYGVVAGASERTTYHRLLEDLWTPDSAASWDAGSRSIRNSLFPVSPRLITIAVLDPRVWPQAQVINLLGLFLDEPFRDGSGQLVVNGVIVPMAGSFDPDAPQLTQQSTFLRTVAVVR